MTTRAQLSGGADLVDGAEDERHQGCLVGLGGGRRCVVWVVMSVLLVAVRRCAATCRSTLGPGAPARIR